MYQKIACKEIRTKLAYLGNDAFYNVGKILTSGKTFFRGDLVMKKIFTAVLSPPLIQEGQLSVTVERMCTKYW